MNTKTVNRGVRLTPAHVEKVNHLAALLGVSGNEVFGRLIEAAEVTEPSRPGKVSVKAKSDDPAIAAFLV